ncbi:MAG TPA: hypothetical protein VJZ27_06430, partial [Aggregatilineales bacterium]|nr:hypothetical protein [Aggregatilineales bacterium]
GEIILQGAWVFLTWNVEVVEYFAGIAWADREIHLSQEAVVLFFVFLCLMMLYQATRPRWAMEFLQKSRIPMRVVQAAAAILLVILVYTILQRPDDRLHVSFLDSGQSVLVESPGGAIILINGGRFPTRLLDQLGDKLPPRTRHLDVLIVTTPAENSIAALPEIVERYEIGAALTNAQASDNASANYTALLERLDSEEIASVPLTAGYTLTTDDGLRIEVIQPDMPPVSEDDAFTGELVLRLTYGDVVFLLTGNIDAEIESHLLENPHLMQANVLQIPNGGSGDSSSAVFVKVVNPQLAVLQADPEDGDPSPNVIQRFSQIPLFRTDQNGSTEIISDGKTLWVETAQK